MAASLVQVGTRAEYTTQTSLAVACSVGVPVGSLLVLRAAWKDHRHGPQATGTVTDTQSNTWQWDRRFYSTTVNTPNAFYMASTVVTNALTTSDSITITAVANSAAAAIYIVYYTENQTTGWFDLDNVFSSGTGTTAAPSTTLTPTAGTRVLHGTLQTAGIPTDTFTQDTDTDGGVGWTTHPTRFGTNSGSATSNISMVGGWKELVASGSTTYTYNPTTGTARLTSQDLASYKTGAGGGGATVAARLTLPTHQGAY